MTWIYYVPTWLLAPLVVAAFVVATVAGLRLARSTYRNDAITHNDVAAPILTLLGTVLAVMLSFLVVTVWQEFDNSAGGVQKEATSALNLYRMAPYLPGGVGPSVRGMVRDSLQMAITQEWPAMRRGGFAPGLSTINDRLLKTVAGAANHGNTMVSQEALDDVLRMIDARRNRLHDNETGIPAFMWGVMLFVAAITIVFSYYLYVANPRAHELMVSAIAATIAIMFVLIAELDYPFRGDVSIAPTALQHVLFTMNGRLTF